jgi:hypothetical protein
MSIGEFMAGVDRLLTRAHALYPGGGGTAQVTSGGGGGGVPSVPEGSSGLAAGASSAAEGYHGSRTQVSGLDGDLEQAVRQGDLVVEQGRTGSGAILEQARTFSSSVGPLANTGPGAQLVVATLDQHVQAMGRQLDTTQAGLQAVDQQLRVTGAGYQTVAGEPGEGPPKDKPQIQAAGFDRNNIPQGPGDQIPQGPDGQYFDPHHPFVGDERFGHWEQFVPPPYTGDTPPPPPTSHVDFPPGTPAKVGGPSGFYTPGRTWVTDDQAPFGSYSEQYKFRISGEDLTSFTRTATVNGQPELQRWVANTYEAQQTTQINLGGPAWASTDPNPVEGTLGGVTTGGLAGITPPPIFHDWQPMTPQQMVTLSATNPTATYYVPDGCGGQFTFKGGVPVGGAAPGPVIPRMTAGP